MIHFEDLGYYGEQAEKWRFLLNAVLKEKQAIERRTVSEESVFEWEVACAAIEECETSAEYYGEKARLVAEENEAKLKEEAKQEKAKVCQKTEGDCVLTTEAES